ncbi:MAG: SDR family oxidoreductase [Synechococcales cyanobacterium T60_A2020_003]|nr:SDR family oxidoreductase [Synechococcales cyanobacterium T60_A2020_003]
MTRTALITGASQGSGLAIARRFARQGYDVVMVARQEERLRSAAEEVAQFGHQVLAIPADVGKASEVAALVKKALNQYECIDVLINNAGFCLTGDMVDTTLEDWHQIMDTNLWGYVHTIHALLPSFLEQGRGVIVNVGSFGGQMPLPHMTAYCTSKYAVTGLTHTLRLELAPQGIHVALVQPGMINSDFLERAVFRGNVEAQRAQMANLASSAWVSQPDDIAEAVWDVVVHRKPELVVGPAQFVTEAYRLFPGLMQWAMQT